MGEHELANDPRDRRECRTGPLARGTALGARQLERMREELTGKLWERSVCLGEELLPTYVLPYFVPIESLIPWAARSEQLLAHAERLARAALDDDAFLDRLKLPARSKELLRTDPGYRRITVVSRPDTLVGPDGPVVIELNCDCPAMMTYADVVSECLFELPDLEPFREGVTPELRTDRLLETLLDCYREFGGTEAPPTIAIAEWPGGLCRPEDELLAQRFEAKGVPTMVCDPRSFRREGARLTAAGRPVHLVYRRMSTREVLTRQSEIEPLLGAYRDGVVCMVNPLRSYVASSKTLLAMLCEELPRGSLAETMVIRPAMEDQLRRPGRWVLKRAESSGGDDVLLPGLASDREWDEALVRARSEVWVAQEVCPISTLEMPFVETTGGKVGLAPMFYNWNPFLFSGAYAGSVVCASDSAMVNQNKGGSLLTVWPYAGQRPASVEGRG